MTHQNKFYYDSLERLSVLNEIINNNEILKNLNVNLNDIKDLNNYEMTKYNKFLEKIKGSKFENIKIYNRAQYYELMTFLNMLFSQILQDIKNKELLNDFYNYESPLLKINNINIFCHNVPDNLNKKEPMMLILKSAYNNDITNKINMNYLFFDIFTILKERYNIEGLVLELGTISY